LEATEEIVFDKKDYYVSNKALYQNYLKWYAAIDVAKLAGEERPEIPPEILDAMLRISKRLKYKWNFINYTYHDDMIGDALYDCIRFSDKFDPTRSENPFSYITTICWNAFLRRIDLEKTQTYAKATLVVGSTLVEDIIVQCNESAGEYGNQYVQFLKDTGNEIKSIPMSVKRTKAWRRINTPDEFLEVAKLGVFDTLDE